MVKLRLARTGSKKRAIYRVVAADARSPRDGRFVEQFGFYNPAPDPAEIRFDGERLDHWLSVGAQPTQTVKRLISKWRKQQPAAS